MLALKQPLRLDEPVFHVTQKFAKHPVADAHLATGRGVTFVQRERRGLARLVSRCTGVKLTRQPREHIHVSGETCYATSRSSVIACLARKKFVSDTFESLYAPALK